MLCFLNQRKLRAHAREVDKDVDFGSVDDRGSAIEEESVEAVPAFKQDGVAHVEEG